MRRRPQPNHRRGLLRAGIAVVVLLAILLAALLIVASLTAPAANAPAPTPPSTPVVPKTPGKSTGTVTPRNTPRPTIAPTINHGGTSKDVGLGRAPLANVAPATALRRVTAGSVAYFGRRGNAYRGSMLYVRTQRSRTPRVVGQADRFVRPVWSPDRRALLYVTVAATARFPGARWSLLRYDLNTGTSTRIVQVVGMGLEPLGWRNGRVLYTLAHSSGTDTSVFAAAPAGSHFLSILTTQEVNSASLSPDSRWIAFFSPADCSYCTLSLFDLENFTTWYGPSGTPNAYDLAWNRQGTDVVVKLGSHLAAIDTATHDIRTFDVPAHLPMVWSSPLTALLSAHGLTLIDQASGRSFVAAPIEPRS